MGYMVLGWNRRTGHFFDVSITFWFLFFKSIGGRHDEAE
jgi:hypothetical protein